MDLSYYTIDDVSLGPGKLFHRGWRLRQHDTLKKALAHYKALSPAAVKALGIADSAHTLDLVRCLKIYEGDQTGEDVLYADPKNDAWWRDERSAAEAAVECVSALNIRYAVDGNVLIPMPRPKGLPRSLHGQQLWLGLGSDPFAAVRRVLAARRGWVSPQILKTSHDPRPLVLKYQVDCVDAQGAYSYREMEPWAYKLLLQKTLERQNNKEETKT